MEDIPQPSSEPYSTGDTVQIYLSDTDPDERYHGRVGVIVGVHTDNLDWHTDRELDKYSYTVRAVETGEELPVPFRHWDLVKPASNNDRDSID